MTNRVLLLCLAIVSFLLLIVLIVSDSSQAKLEAILLPLGLTFGFASFLP